MTMKNDDMEVEEETRTIGVCGQRIYEYSEAPMAKSSGNEYSEHGMIDEDGDAADEFFQVEADGSLSSIAGSTIAGSHHGDSPRCGTPDSGSMPSLLGGDNEEEAPAPTKPQEENASTAGFSSQETKMPCDHSKQRAIGEGVHAQSTWSPAQAQAESRPFPRQAWTGDSPKSTPRERQLSPAELLLSILMNEQCEEEREVEQRRTRMLEERRRALLAQEEERTRREVEKRRRAAIEEEIRMRLAEEEERRQLARAIQAERQKRAMAIHAARQSEERERELLRRAAFASRPSSLFGSCPRASAMHEDTRDDPFVGGAAFWPMFAR